MASSSVPLSISESDQSSSLLAALDRLERANSEVCSSKLLDLLELLLKILSKAIEFPSDFRWRRFKCDSPLFQQKIAALKEWHGVLTALNFMPIWQDDVQMHENDASAESSSDSEWANVSLMVMKDEVTQQQLLAIQKCLKNTKTIWLTKYTQTPAASVRLPTYSSSSSSQPADSSVSSSSPSFAKFMRADEDSKIGTSAAPISLPVVSNPISPITSRNDKCYSSAAAASAEVRSSSACQINSQSSSSSSSSFSSSSSSSSVSSASSSSSSSPSSSSSLSGAAFDVAVAQLIAMGFPPDACSVALRRHGYLERAISELGKLSHDSQSLELAHKLQLEEHEQKSKQSFHDEQLAKQVAEQFAREADFHKSEREQRRKLEEQQSEEFIRSMQATHDREKKDSEVARKLLDDKLTLELVEEQFLRGETLPLEQNNLRILWDTGAVDSTFSCGVCYEEFKLSQVQVIDCNKHHVYCINCLESYINTEIGNGKLNMMCPNASICKHELSFRELSYSAKRSQLDRLNQLLTNQHLQSDTNVRWCPRAGCAIPMIGDADSRMMICPRCKRQFCFKCKTEEWHSGATCEDFQQWKIENSQADARFEDWRKANTKNCPRCNASIQKSGGCSHMTCRCGHEFVWETLKPYR